MYQTKVWKKPQAPDRVYGDKGAIDRLLRRYPDEYKVYYCDLNRALDGGPTVWLEGRGHENGC
jgi:hypothetical protein